MKTPLIIVTVLAASVGLGATQSAHAGNCSDMSQVKSTVLKVLKGACKVAGDKFDCGPVLKSAAKLNALQKKWNTEFKNSRFKIGPRALPIGKRMRGTLLAGGVRTWISVAAMDGDNAVVNVKKLAGKAADITVCTIGADGRRTKVGEFKFAARTRDGSAKGIPLRGLRGKAVLIKLNAKKLNKFKYDVTLKAGGRNRR